MSNFEVTNHSLPFNGSSTGSVRAGVSRLLKSVYRAIRQRLEAYDRRQRLIYLLSYDDHILDDMGYTRADLEMISKLPLGTDAHQVLRELSEQRKVSYRRG